MDRNNRIAHIDSQLIPSARDAQILYHQAGGHITSDSSFGIDPLAESEGKKALRLYAFHERYQSFDLIFFDVVNSRPFIFHEALLFYISSTY